MLLTITSTAPQATDLGYLLHKHPDRAQHFDLAAGVAHVFYPDAAPDRCTAALLLEIDPIALVRGRRPNDAFALGQYVNDRPYAAASMLAVAIGKVFRTAMAGRCEARPELPGRPLPLRLHLPALRSAGGAEQVRALFEPLGWSVQTKAIPLDESIAEWGESRYVDTTLTGTQLLSEALTHLYVLLPVLDNTKHYWVSADEVDKLLRAGGAWLAGHPERDLITNRYLRYRPRLVTTALARLAVADDLEPEALDPVALDDDAGPVPAVLPLVELRKRAVLEALREARAATVLDLGCGSASLLRELIRDGRFTEVVGVDVSPGALEAAERRLRLDRMPDAQRSRLRLLQSSVTYRDQRLAGYDAAVLMEVIEHVDPDRLPALEATVFDHARPATVVVTTPNVEHNVRFAGLAAGTLRHPDHRFEWTRAQFQDWARAVAGRTGYEVAFHPVGEDDPAVGPPTQLAVFSKQAGVCGLAG